MYDPIPEFDAPQDKSVAELDHSSEYYQVLQEVITLRQNIVSQYDQMITDVSRYLASNPGDAPALVTDVDTSAPELKVLFSVGNMYCDFDVERTINWIAENVFTRLQEIDKLTTRVLHGDYEGIDSELVSVVLREMPYNEYLQTPHWQSIRRGALDRAHKRCQVCNSNSEKLHVHHRTYENRGKELVEDVIVLCATCHQTFHDNGRLAK